MKKISLIILLSLLINCISSGQDYSNYSPISGFKNPALSSGQYMVSLTPHYYNSSPTRLANDNRSEKPNIRATTLLDSYSGNISYYDFSIASLYGITNDLTLSFNMTLFPKQKAESYSDYQVVNNYTVPYSDIYTTNGVFDKNNINGNLIVSFRPQRNIELSLSAQYYTLTSISSNTSTFSSNTIGSGYSYRSIYNSTQKQNQYDISFSIVLIGN